VSTVASFVPLSPRHQSASPLLQTMRQAGTVRIAVKDSGAGLTIKQLEEICAEGVQFNANELQAGQGSGLGLFISKGIVEQHGGRLLVESEGLGRGVTFTVELPLFRYDWHGKSVRDSLRSIQSKSSGHASIHSFSVSGGLRSSAMDISTIGEADEATLLGDRVTLFQPLPAAAADHGPRRLLVVDDSPFNRKMLVRLLASKGHTCEQAEDGTTALQVYREMATRDEPPDAILMDFEMPVMNGPTATARLREMGCTCLIVGVTGNVLPADVASFLDHGADNVLPKPLVLEDFELLLIKHVRPSMPPPKLSLLDQTARFSMSSKKRTESNDESVSTPYATQHKIHPEELA
jgi:CheY-like chemotaxis protein